MDSDDTLDLAIITVLLNEARKCLNIMTGADEVEYTASSVTPDGDVQIKEEVVDTEEDEPPGDDAYCYYNRPDKKYEAYIKKICNNDPDEFKEHVSISMEAFDLLYDLVKRDVRKLSYRSVTPKCRLFMTLVYLANGGSKSSLSTIFDMPASTAHKVLSETCKALWKPLHKKYLPNKKRSDWYEISKKFESKCNVPNCVGAVDFRTIELRCPKKDMLNYYQKRGKYSITIFGACDADYKFTGIDLSFHEKDKEGSEIWTTGFEKELIKGTLPLPNAIYLPNSRTKCPYYFVGDSICPLKHWLMRNYPTKQDQNNHAVFNLHMRGPYQIIDNSFGVMAARWKILTTQLILSPEKMESLLKAVILLHNFALTHDSTYMPFGYIDRYDGDLLIRGEWRSEISPLRKPKKMYANNSTQSCYKLRDRLSEYFERNVTKETAKGDNADATIAYDNPDADDNPDEMIAEDNADETIAEDNADETFTDDNPDATIADDNPDETVSVEDSEESDLDENAVETFTDDNSNEWIGTDDNSVETITDENPKVLPKTEPILEMEAMETEN